MCESSLWESIPTPHPLPPLPVLCSERTRLGDVLSRFGVVKFAVASSSRPSVSPSVSPRIPRVTGEPVQPSFAKEAVGDSVGAVVVACVCCCQLLLRLLMPPSPSHSIYLTRARRFSECNITCRSDRRTGRQTPSVYCPVASTTGLLYRCGF